MRILIACDSFKGSLSSLEVACFLAPPLTTAGHDVEIIPLADGGEGTLDALITCGFTAHHTTVSGPLGEPSEARWASRGETAVVEMAQASGLHLVDPSPDTAWQAHTYGTGEIIVAALRAGFTHIVLGVGGSATTDGGVGMIHALTTAGFVPNHMQGVTFTLASDVTNPLTGKNGAATIFGPQKGADPATVRRLEKRLNTLGDTWDPQQRYRNAPGAGAAGGLGFAALAKLGATRISGADFVLEATGFDKRLSQADVVITGEGRFDTQTLHGKGPGTIINRANAVGVMTVVVCGQATLTVDDVPTLAGVYALSDYAPLEVCLTEPGRVLTQLGARLGEQLGTEAREKR